MKRILLLILLLPVYSLAQNQVSGIVRDSATRVVLSGILVSAERSTLTNEAGRFSLQVSGGRVTLSGVGYQKRSILVKDLKYGEDILLVAKPTALADVSISGNNIDPYKAISEMDIKLRGVSNSQEVLRIVPGLFIGQHQGGGKAEQIFLRGFDNDHGTDLNMSVDGMPINMVSQAHGQGYADSHFIIPETIENTTYEKGMYNAQKGDLAVTGFVDFHTANVIDRSYIKAEAGQFATRRLLGMVDLLGSKARAKGQNWYAASDYRYSDSYFDNPQNFKRFNFFTKYYGALGQNNRLSLSASTMYSKWKASGQIPDYAVDNGSIGFYGAIDPNEGGLTSRTNVNAQLLTTLSAHSLLKNQVYYSRYHFDLNSNFTFFLDDPVNGDELRQRESRDLLGYTGSYVNDGDLNGHQLTTEFGINARADATYNSELSHTINNFTVADPIKLGDIRELSTGVYVNETLQLGKLTINAGLRFDQFNHRYNNKLAADSTLSGAGIYNAANNVVSPKLKLSYQLSNKAQLYWFAGKGFHSNDARVVVAQKGIETLPAAYGTDFGTMLKPAHNLLINAAVWYSYLQKEYVYAGDGGSVEFSGRTKRLGADLSVRYQPLKSIYLDADLNYAHGRSLDDPAGENYIPLAPVWSSTGGASFNLNNGFNGSLRYRWLGDRAANADYSLTAKGYFVNDMVLNYTKRKYEIGLTINNLFDVRWKETQFETLTRLRGQDPVNSIAFTAGSKSFAVAHLSYFFK